MPDNTPHAISLVLGLNGWRVYLTPGGPKVGYPLTVSQAEDLGRSVTEVLGTVTEDESAVTPYQVVRSGTEVLQDAVKAELAEAEEKAATIPNLRRTLAELDQ